MLQSLFHLSPRIFQISMKLLVYFTIVIFLFTSCATSSKTQKVEEEVVFDDRYEENANGEIVFNDNFTKDEIKPNAVSQKIGSTPVSRTEIDGSNITYSTDSYGNQTESRCFNNNTRISCVLLKTSAEGKKTGLVYAQNGKIKDLPSEMFDKFMTAPADDLANAAGIVETKNEFTLPVRAARKPQTSPVQPLPSYKFPVQPKIETQQPAELKTEDSANSRTTETEPKINSQEDKNN